MDDAFELARLVESLDVPAMGSGDPIAGVNLLACMACTLANLAPDDGSVVHQDGSRARLGSSLLVMGGASTGLVVDEIITEVNRLQNNLTANLEGYFDWVEEMKARPGYSMDRPARSPQPQATAQLVYSSQPDLGTPHSDIVAYWRTLLEQAPLQTVEQISKQPRVLVSVGGRKDIESQLTRLRSGCPLVHLGLTTPEDLARYSEVGSALLEGRYPADDGIRTVKGNILITDPMQMLMAAARNPDERTAWLGQLLWLADGDSGPDVPTGGHVCTNPSSVRIDQRFREALGRVLTYRLNLPEMKPLVLFTDTREAMARWSGFLREIEPRLPGISGAARNLLNSLVFGLGLMATRASRITLAGIEAMSRFLVRRMANLRTAILHAGELARRREQITRIFHKLSNGPTQARKFCRDLRLTSVERDVALRWMEAASLVTCGPNGWQLQEGARLNFKDSSLPIIEV
jgi:hypothetical protein